MRSDCATSERALAYVRGELRGVAADLFEAHVAGCSACAARLADEAGLEAALYELGDDVEHELAREASWWASARAWWRGRRFARVPSWSPLAVATGLALVMCDLAATRGMVDAPSPAPGAVLARRGDAAPVDETLPVMGAVPGCEDVADASASDDGPVCVDAALALASFPPEEGDLGYAFDDEGVCRPDDGGDLVCADDEASG